MIIKKQYSDFLLNLMLVIYLTELIFPRINYIANPAYVKIICLVMWFTLSFLKKPRYYYNIRPPILSSLLCFFATITVPYIWGYRVIANRYAALAMIPLAYVIYDYYSYRKKIYQLKKILIFVYFLSAITAITTLSALMTNPFISRSIKSGGEVSARLAQRGIGGYHFIYFVVASSIVFLFLLLKSTKKALKILMLVICLFTMFLILSSNYMTALVIAVTGFMIMMILNATSKKNVAAKLAIGFVLMLLLMNLNTIIIACSDFIPLRIAKVIMPTANKSVLWTVYDEFIRDRWPTLLESMTAFKKNPLLGMMGSQTLSYSDGTLSGLGQHSHILDTFAFYGIGIGLWMVYVILIPFIDKKGKGIHQTSSLNCAMMVCTLLLYLFNNATDSIAIVVGIVMPTVREIYSNNVDNAIMCEPDRRDGFENSKDPR